MAESCSNVSTTSIVDHYCQPINLNIHDISLNLKLGTERQPLRDVGMGLTSDPSYYTPRNGMKKKVPGSMRPYTFTSRIMFHDLNKFDADVPEKLKRQMQMRMGWTGNVYSS